MPEPQSPPLRATAATLLKILLFRGGPQDMPYSPTLVRLLVPVAALVSWLLFAILLPPLVAALMAVINVLGTVLVAEGILRARDLRNRAPQTLAALLGVAIVVNLLMLYPASVLAPHLAEIAKNPDLLKHPDKVHLPAGPIFAIDGLNIWGFAVSAWIYRHAANVRVLGGVGFALLASLVVMTFALLSASVLSALSG